MQPKCRLCGSRTWRFIRELSTGKKSVFFYQDGNGHIHILDSLIEDTKSPMEVIG